MLEQERNERIQKGREWIRWTDLEYDSDQELKRVQPPLTKAAVSDVRIGLPKQFQSLDLKKDFVEIIFRRRSNRIFTQEKMTLLELSFLLWSTQGVKEIRGNQYATLRTVPSGGARHPFETYLFVGQVDGLEPGLYHYLPLEHELELLKKIDFQNEEFKEQFVQSVCGQKWALKANVTFFYSIVPYRGEWRYAFDAHRVMMMDAGHVTENLYLACSAMNLGTCAIAAADTKIGTEMFSLDGEEEFVFYVAPVGTISEQNEEEEQSFYAFLKEE